MRRRGLALRGARFFWRTHTGVMAGAAIGSAVLVGALAVGDSVRRTLRDQALLRIGQVETALIGGDRFVRLSLADDLDAAMDDARVAPVVRLDGLASTPDAHRLANGVKVYGVDARFFGMASEIDAVTVPGPGEVLLNDRLARQLDAAVGSEIIVRLEQPSAMPRDMVLSVNEALSLALRVTVRSIVPEGAFGRFGLEANQIPHSNAFLDLAWVQEQLGVGARVNLLLVAGGGPAMADEALRRTWTPADAELDTQARPAFDAIDVVSRRIFIDDPVGDALGAVTPDAAGILTYFVNELCSGDRATPYSMVSAVGPIAETTGAAPPTGREGAWSWRSLIPPDLADDEIVINRWLADDLDAGPGDAIEITFFVLGQARRLVERSADFRVRSIVEIDGPAADRTLMPAFPGLAESEHCREWEPGIPIELDRIRDADERYWDDYRGTPKAFVTLAAGRRMWGNRFGALTAVRLPAEREDATLAAFRAAFDPAAVGLFFRDVRGPALAASATTTDFGGLFLGLSLFLIVSALLLVALLFAFGIQQRATEIGTLLAVGLRPAVVVHLLMREAALIAGIGCVIGAFVGLGYTRLVLLGLETVWRDAIGATSIELHVSGASIAIGAAAAFGSALLTIWITLRRHVRRPVVELLAGIAPQRAEAAAGARGRRWTISASAAVTCVVVAVAIVLLVGADRGAIAAAAFFGAGSLLLVATVAFAHALLARLDRGPARPRPTVAGLGVRNGVRRPGRSLAVVTLIACGTFLVAAVGANQLGTLADPTSRATGTGGFALYARSTIGVPHDLGSTRGRDAFALGDDELRGVEIVPMRLREGDDASCLNLSRAQQPQLLAVNPSALDERGAFTFAKTLAGHPGERPWRLLELDLSEARGRPVVPAIGDQASLTWAMHKRVGDTLDYRDEQGRPFTVRIVGAVANSILQGNLVISEHRFTELYPSESGYRVFLIDAPPERAAATAESLSRAMADVGLEAMPAAARLAEFNAVQNTYLAIFQLLGGLGVLLGSAGLGMVVLRNVLERRGELAVLRAVGFRAGALRWLVFSEHGLLLALGLVGGTVAAFVAVLPALRTPGTEPPIVSTAVILLAIALSGFFWVWLATVWGLRGRIPDALRNE